MPQKELSDRRRLLADELNRFIQMKKDFSSSEGAKGELFDGAAKTDTEVATEGQS